MAILEVKNIEKHFGATKVLEDISFNLEEGQALANRLLYRERRCLTRLTRTPRRRARYGKSASTSAWCSSPSTCSPSIPP